MLAGSPSLRVANSQAKANWILMPEGQVKFLVEEETGRIIGLHIIGGSSNAAPSCGARCNQLWLCSYLRPKC
jgi:pyruvate/2-oxoglutarate dehydrogenase complex dihydrolipoamide dehydrogenase (E3) component